MGKYFQEVRPSEAEDCKRLLEGLIAVLGWKVEKVNQAYTLDDKPVDIDGDTDLRTVQGPGTYRYKLTQRGNL